MCAKLRQLVLGSYVAKIAIIYIGSAIMSHFPNEIRFSSIMANGQIILGIRHPYSNTLSFLSTSKSVNYKRHIESNSPTSYIANYAIVSSTYTKKMLLLILHITQQPHITLSIPSNVYIWSLSLESVLRWLKNSPA